MNSKRSLLWPRSTGIDRNTCHEDAIMKQISVGSAKLSVYTGGERGYHLLMVHGFPLNHTMWRPQIDFFIDHCRVIAPDLRGFGNSEVVPGVSTMEQMADDLNAVL